MHKELTFVREREGALVTPETPLEENASDKPGVDGLGKDAPVEAVNEQAPAPAIIPAATPAAARQSLQGRKKDNR